MATKVSLRYASAADSASGTLVASSEESALYLPDDLPIPHVHAPTPKLLEQKWSVLDLANVGPNRVHDVLCRKKRERSGSAIGLSLNVGALTVVLAKEAFDSIMTLLDHVELERGAQEPVPHLGATERGAREICDTCGRRWAQSRSSSTSVRTELAGSPYNESPSLVARECVAAWASSRKTCKDLRAGRCQVSLDPDERSRSYS